jgi:hypothetical protein
MAAGLEQAQGGPAAPGVRFTCPRCLAASSSQQDAAEGYCGACHDWTGPPSLIQLRYDPAGDLFR